MGIPPYLPPEKSVCRSRSNRTGHETTDWFNIGERVRQGCILSPWLFNLYAEYIIQIGKGVRQGCILSQCLFNFYAEYIMRNNGLEETQAGIKTAGRNINNLRYAHDTTLMAESEEELTSLLMKVKRKVKKLT